MNFKICTKCYKELPATSEYFGKRKDSKDGLRTDCKECHSKIQRAYKEQHRSELEKYQKEYRNIHQVEKKEYAKKYYPKYYQDNKEDITKRHVEYNRRYIKTPYGKELDRAKKHRHRALDYLNGGSYTVEQWKDCLKYFNNTCAYSGEKLNLDNLNVDHIIPLNNGGTSYIWNICPSINYVNLSKGNRDIEEWYRRQIYFSEERLQKIYNWIEYAKLMY
ncbi:HNH endonuclease [Candidatus Clostridium stratigraminis]|uniref:HNH endonuclease n=1 Tax=Candidatus Clostridium stratigraminis TaxID=3381661 RepID=A0ABW8SZQ5_9CLOT